MLLEGIIIPVPSPFYPDGRLYLRKLEHNVDRYSRTPAAGMLILGSAAEADGLTDEETRETLDATIASAAREKVMIAGVSRASVFATLVLAEAAACAGYDAIAVRAPEFSLEPDRLTYFRAVADSSPLPVILLAERERPLPVAFIAGLASHPQIIAAIDAAASPARLETLLAATAGISRQVTVTTVFAAATGRMLAPAPSQGAANFVSATSLGGGEGVALAEAPPAPALKTRTRNVGFQLLAGSAKAMLKTWQAGATGAAPHLAACTPQGCCEVWQAFKDGDAALAEEKQQRLVSASDLVEGTHGIAALKHGCDLNGYFGGRPRLPLIGLTEDQRRAVEAALAGLRN